MQTDVIEAIKATEVGIDLWPVFMSRSRKEFHFISLDGDKLRVNYRFRKEGETGETFYNLPITSVDADNLKFLGVWDGLSEDVKNKIIKFDEGGVEEENIRLENARKYRRNKYVDIPDQVVCSKCGREQKMNPAIIVARSEKIAKDRNSVYTAEDYVRDFLCQKCFSTKGRKANPNALVKVELVCKCGAKVTYPGSIALKFATKKGITLDQYIKNFACQTCKPSPRGRPKKSDSSMVQNKEGNS